MNTNLRRPGPVVLLLTMAVLLAPPLSAEQHPSQSAEIETELIDLLRSNAAEADKAIACKRLAIHGSSAAVSELAKLLSHERLSSWARIALEAIPGPASDAALRDAATKLEGELLVGAINSIGVRQDPRAVQVLARHLKSDDSNVAAASAVALGHVGGQKAIDLLRKSLTSDSLAVRSAVAEGCILCAEKLQAQGKTAEAIELYDEVRRTDVPQPRVWEATRGSILARGDEGIPLLVEQLRSPEVGLFRIALSTAREFPGGKVDAALASELSGAAGERAALIVTAMADRPETVVLPAVLQAARQGPPQVRVSAIAALGRVGDASCLPTLLEIALDEDPQLAAMAKQTLAELPGEKVDARLVALLASGDDQTLPLLIELIGRRRIAATPALLEALNRKDAAIRHAALTALGETVKFEDLGVLIRQVVSPRHAADGEVARQALLTASVRMPDREACAAELAAAFEQTSQLATKESLLEILGEMGGETALATIAGAAKSSDARLQDVATRLLGTWMTADAAPVLLELATWPDGKYQVRALRGYLRIARQFNLEPPERTAMCRRAWQAATRAAEREMVLDVLQRYPSAENFQLAAVALQHPEHQEKASEVVLSIAQQLGMPQQKLRDLLSAAANEPAKLEIVEAEYGAGANQQDVTESLRKQAGDLRLITLKSPNYNESFGGDPAPGTPKQLRIRSRLNDQEGEASFAENSLILLPVPK